MPRTTNKSMSRNMSSSNKAPARIPVAPPYAVAPFRATNPPSMPTPSFGQTIKEGLGSGIGFGIGNRLVQSFMGGSTTMAAAAPVSTSTTVPKSDPTTVSDYEQCLQNSFDDSEKFKCVNLLVPTMASNEFHQCMKSSDNQIHICKEFLTSQ